VKDDDDISDDEFLSALEKQSDKKKAEVDLDKMTRRQRMAYLEKQGGGQSSSNVGSAQEIGSHNKQNVLNSLKSNDNQLFALGSKRTR